MSLKKFPSFLLNFSEGEMGRKEMHSYTFKTFRLDLAERQLLDNNKPVPLTPKAFDVLVFLVEHSGHLVEKDELMQTVWAESFVEEANISRIIHTLRKALGEDENANKFIETVAKSGYRFVAKVNTVPEPSAPSVDVTGSLQPVAKNPVAIARGSDLLHDETATTPLDKPKHPARIILFTVGFASAIALIFLLSFNFQSGSSAGPSDVKSIQGLQAPRNTTNDEAYRHYLLGVALADRWSQDDNRKAIENFEKAIELDPTYAPAYAGLANAHSVRAFFGGGGNPTEEYLKAKTAVEKALAIDDNLAEAHSYRGEIMTNFEWDFAAAEREHKRAIELNPNSSVVHRMYALLLSFTGRSDEAIAEIKTAIDLEPASILNHRIYGQTLYYAGRYDEAIAENIRLVDMGVDFSAVQDSLIGSYRRKGDDDRAFEWFVRGQVLSEETPDEIQLWKTIYAKSGWRGIFERQREQAKESESKGKVGPFRLARLYCKLENREQAFAYLEKAFSQRLMAMVTLKVQPDFDFLRSDRRFDELVKRVGLK